MTRFLDEYKNRIPIILMIIIGIALRLLFVGRIPGNNNFFQDEAFSAYEAYSMVNYGMDSHGYHNPVYLETWGSGMSAVQCYFQTIFIRFLGLTPVAVRLPQALLGCITLLFFYLLIKEIADEKVAFWSTLVLAICPWHITMSRWGLDCNYYIGFITIAMYFIVSSRNNIGKTILAAIFTAIALYSYASPWVVMPFLVYGTVIYLFARKEISFISIDIFTAILAVLVVPLFLFILVNLGFIGEIRTSFISIPKLSYFRNDDVKPSLENLHTLVTYFWNQYDWISYDSTPKYGTYFGVSNIFLVIGLAKSIFKKSNRAPIMWIWFACAIFMGLTIQANFERINILFLPLIYFIGEGIVFTIEFFKDYKRHAAIAMLVIYGLNGLFFAKYYFTDYNDMMERVWVEGTEEAVVFAKDAAALTGGTVHISGIRHPHVLCYSQYPVDKYIATVVYDDDNAKFLQPLSYEGYDYSEYIEAPSVAGDIYICAEDNTEYVEWLASQNMAYAQFGNYIVGVAN